MTELQELTLVSDGISGRRVGSVQPFPVESVFEHLASDPDVGVVVFDPEGSVLFTNRAVIEHFTGPNYTGTGAGGDAGGALENLFPREFASRFLLMARQAADSRARVYRRTIWKGRRVIVSCSMVSPGDGGRTVALLVLRCVTALDGAEPAEDLGVVELGVLDVLTDRELEILAHIAKGRTAKRIAQALDLSPKTVEWHRAVIGRKLGQNNRVLLTRLALQAGLTESDNGQARFRREQRRHRMS